MSALLVLLILPLKYSVRFIRAVGIDSPLIHNVSLIQYVFSSGFHFDVDNAKARLRLASYRPPTTYMHNQNIELPRVITRGELLLSERPIENAVGDAFFIIKGKAGDASNEPDGASPDPYGSVTDDQTHHPGWTTSAGDDSAQRYSRSRLINKENVKNLRPVHVVDVAAAFKGQWRINSESTPLNWGALVFWISADDRLVAANVETGEIVWQLKVPSFDYSRRGFLLDDRDAVGHATLYVPMGEFIVALDAATGRPVSDVSGNGVIRLNGAATLVSPLIWNGQLIIADYNRQAIVGIDLKSGVTQWTVPLHDERRNFTGGVPWGGMSIDRGRALLFVTTGNPRPALLGTNRPGDNKNSDSVVAIELNRKQIKWTFQEARHDLWDFDIPASPILTRITLNNRTFDVVVAVTKIGNTLILDRETGRPIFDFRLRRAPASRHINEHTATYQPDVLTPEPLIDIAFSPTMVTDVSQESRYFVQQQLSDQSTIYGRFRPPELNRDLVTFGLHGGAEWPGASISQEDGTLYVQVNMIPWVIRVYLQAPGSYRLTKIRDRQGGSLYASKCASCHLDSGNGVFESVGEAATRYVPALHGYTMLPENKSLFQVKSFGLRPDHRMTLVTQPELDELWALLETSDKTLFEHEHVDLASHWRLLLDQHGLPGSAPPWGKVVALQLSSGRKLWEVPIGEKIIDGTPVNTGSPSFGGLVATSGGLLFVVGTDDRFVRALDKDSGSTLWRYRMSAAGSAPPATFVVNGKQYICVVATGGRYHNFVDKADKLYIFSL